MLEKSEVERLEFLRREANLALLNLMVAEFTAGGIAEILELKRRFQEEAGENKGE